MEHATKNYSIHYKNGSIAFLRIHASTPDEIQKPAFRRRLPLASYGPQPNELTRCPVTDSYASETFLSVTTPQGYLSHEFGESPEWYTTHAVKILNPKPETNVPEVGSQGSILCEIELAEGDEKAYFCLLEGYLKALYGRSLQSLAECELLEPVEIFRDGGTLNVATKDGTLYIPSPFEVDDHPEWSVSHRITLESQ